MKTVIPIVLISDNNYCLATSATIESIIKNKHPESLYEIYILGIDISPKNKTLLEKQSCNNAKVIVIEQENKYKDINYIHPYISKALFFKFDIANTFNQYDKIIYLDGDTIVNSDLTEFYTTDLENNYVGAVKDLILLSELHHKAINTNSYFNAGVLLLNTKRIREENLYPKFVEELTTHNYEHSEQDIFNIIFNKQIKFLSLKYNYISLYYLPEIRTTLNPEDMEDFEQSGINPLIIHYAGDKPWNLKKGAKFEVWQQYFKKSPYKREKLTYQKNKKLFEFDILSDRKKLRIFGISFNFKRKSKKCE